MHCDFAFYVGGTHENVTDLPELERLPGCAGVKVFMGSSTGTLLVADDAGVEAILSAFRAAPPSTPRTNTCSRNASTCAFPAIPRHPVWRAPEAAISVRGAWSTCPHETGKRIHVLHISTADEMVFLADHKDVASVEVTPHHLTLEATDYTRARHLRADEPAGPRQGTSRRHLGRRCATASPISSAPTMPRIPARKRPTSLSGEPFRHDRRADAGPIMLDHVNAGRMTLERFVDMTSHGPNRLFGIAGKGRIAVGYDADLTIVDLKRRETITNDWVASRAGWTPYDGVEVTGWPVGTIVRGRVMWEGALTAAGQGERVRFLETLAR